MKDSKGENTQTKKEGRKIETQETEKALQVIKYNILSCNVEQLRSIYTSFAQMASTSLNKEVQFYYNLLKSSFQPEECVKSFIVSKCDNYWELFWAFVAFLKLGRIDSATVLLPRIDECSQHEGNAYLLKAVSSIAEWHKSGVELYRGDARHYLGLSTEKGISPEVLPLQKAAYESIKDEPNPAPDFRFFYQVTLSPTTSFFSHDSATK